MSLADERLEVLEQLRKFRGHPPTTPDLLKAVLGQYYFQGGLLCLAAFLAWLAGAWYISLVVAGLLLGALHRDYLWCQTAAELWPLGDELLHWEKLDELIEKYQRPDA